MRPMPELEITTVSVADLIPYAVNAKQHPHGQVDQIAASIEQFGNCDPIGVWHNDAVHQGADPERCGRAWNLTLWYNMP